VLEQYNGRRIGYGCIGETSGLNGEDGRIKSFFGLIMFRGTRWSNFLTFYNIIKRAASAIV